ncbi:pseudaminic acid synthase [Clostridium sporogenes]|uniref:pseudaminic acid synthase n=1 Tax=Clostridium TaxID=1485 RepID=UPI0013D67FC3|nr:pseudaminic acid synthase [Clostridium sporogenes]EJP6470956.1 pseudaminic acid synthase [Clostridium botulinum]NFV12943.1 pseudaminic acid synthase [Clostridium sporogenes]
MNKDIYIANRKISEKGSTFIIAEISANHLMNYDRAVDIMVAAKESGADAVKLQTYTPDTITIDCNKEEFLATPGSPWEGMNLYQLYQTAYTPWEWQPKLMQLAKELDIVCFSSPFDLTAVDFMEEMNMPAYKVASFEINDIPLIKKIARKGKPIIISTGISYMNEIEEAVRTCKEEGNENIILLKCTSAYPAPYEDINLRTIPNMKEAFGCIIGLSDHTLGDSVALASVAIGAKVIEKHLTLRRDDGGPDSTFSMEPEEFANMVKNIRIIEKAMGRVTYELTEKQKNSRDRSRSLYVVEDIIEGEAFTDKNIRSIRPGHGLHTRYYESILGKKARCNLKKGTALQWKYID